MVDKLRCKYIYKKRNVYYFSKHVPQDLSSYYDRKRIVFSMKTKSYQHALHLSKSYTQQLEDEWLTIRVKKFKTFMNFDDANQKKSNAPLLSSSLNLYFKLKGVGKGDIFFRASKRAVKNIIECLGDRPVNLYSTIDAATFRDYLFKRGLVSSSVRRVFSIIRAIINLTILEFGLENKNGFSRTFIPDLNDIKKRKPIPLNEIRKIQKECVKINDQNRWLIVMISDTGMRLSEALGLASDDIILHEKIPYITLRPYPWRQLKTKSSERKIPLVSYALWAAKKIVKQGNKFAFPKYCNETFCKTNSASASLNKWLHNRTSKDFVIHSFRHSFRDRLRKANVSSEMIDQICGWTTNSVGEKYGSGFELKTIYNKIRNI